MRAQRQNSLCAHLVYKEVLNMTDGKKRIEIVKVKMVKESTLNYSPRRISSPHDAIGLIKYMIDDSDRENFIVVCLDTKNQPTHVEICSKGSLNASIVHPREVFKTAIISNSASIMLAHNHPSGDINPSNEDIAITKRLIEAGAIIGIKILDHVIIDGDEGKYYSFSENDMI